MKKRSHYAIAHRSDRLMAVYHALKDRMYHSTRQLIKETGQCAINSIVHELRQNGIKIECRYVRTTDTGARVYVYRLLK